DPLLRDLPVIDNLELYEPVASMDFLRQLQTAGLFKDTSDTAKSTSSQDAHVTNAATLQLTIPDSISKRREWVEALSQDEKLELRRNLRRFLEELSPKQQQALRDFDQQLRYDPKSDDLSRTVERFYEWWNTLHSEYRSRWDDE